MSGTSQPLSVTQGSTSGTSVAANIRDLAFGNIKVPSTPFQNVAITDPNPNQLLSAVVTVSGPVPAQVSTTPALQNLSAAALAAALDQTVVNLSGDAGGTDTVTAAITDIAGQSATLTSTDTLVPTQTKDTVTITSPSETSTNASQTITGTATTSEVASDGTVESSGPLANTSVMISTAAGPSSLSTMVTTDANGNFSTNVTLPALGSYEFVALVTTPATIFTSNTVTDTLVAPITATETPTSVTDAVTVAAGAPPGVAAPFQSVAITDPNPAALLSATVTLSGPVSGTLTLPPSLQNLSASALAAALDTVSLSVPGTGSPGAYADTVTATIADTAGQSATLATTVNLLLALPATQTVTAVALTSPAETSPAAAQTITGTVETETLNDQNQVVGTAPIAGAAVTLSDNGTVIGTAVSGADGSFSADVTLPVQGANIITASIPGSNGPVKSAPVTDTLLPPPPTVIGSGPETLALFLSQRAEPTGAEFTVSVDGQQVGGVQTTTANALTGEQQEFDVKTDVPAGVNTVSIAYVNAADSLLYLDSVFAPGLNVQGGTFALGNNGASSFSFNGPYDPNLTTIGSGPDSLTLFVSERAQPTGAEFTVDVNGTQIGGVQTTAADALAGQVQQFDVLGNFPAGTDNVTINDLNASNSLLFVNNAFLGNTEVPGSSFVLSNVGAGSFAITGPDPTVPTAVSTVGTGPDTLTLDTSERAEPAGALFTVDVDGTQIGGVQATTADSTTGQFQELDLLGNFAPGVSHSVSVNYLNASNSLLVIDSAAINGSSIAGGSEVLSNNGSLGFSFIPPPAPSPVTVGSGPDSLALNVLEAGYFQGNSQFTLSVDGTQIGGVQTAQASIFNSPPQVFDVLGSFAGTHTVSVDFLNAASAGAGTSGLVRQLYVQGAMIDGTAISGSNLVLTSTESQGFTFTH